MPACGKALEGPVTADARIGTDCRPGAVGDVDACLLARQVVDQHAKRCRETRHKGNKAPIRGQLTKAVTIFLFDSMHPEVLEILERGEVKQHHDEQHLAQ